MEAGDKLPQFWVPGSVTGITIKREIIMEFKRCAMPELNLAHVERALGDKAENILGFSTPVIGRERLHLPSAASIVAKMAAKLGLPVIVKINHNELLTTPAKYDQTMFATAKAAADMGARAIGITIYFGSDESRRQMEEVRDAFQAAREAGLATIAWCYLRNAKAFKAREEGKDTATDFHDEAALTSQAIHLAASLGADIVKQKLATKAGGIPAIRAAGTGVLNTKDVDIAHVIGTHPIDWVRAQVAAAYMGRIGLINSGGESKGASDLDDAIATAVINLRAGGTGLISGRKAFQKPMAEGIALLQAIQDA